LPTSPKVVISPANNVCEGQAITLLIEGNDKVLWSNSDTSKNIKVEKLGNYELSVKINNDFGCVSLPTVLPKLSINPLPMQPSIAQIGLYSLQVKDTDLLENDQFEWMKDNTIISKTNTPLLKTSQNGNYSVSVIRNYKTSDNQSFNCVSKPSVILFFQTATNTISLYPNPATDLVYLETKEVIKNLEVKFYTPQGKQVYKFRLDDTFERKDIDLRFLEKGNYIVRIKGDGFEESVRLIILSK
jgi:hypothetical protein